MKYYYKDENGNEILARTSNREYHYYCGGSCSKTKDGANVERLYQIKRTALAIKRYQNVLKLADDKFEVWQEKNCYNPTTKDDVKRWIDEAIERLDRLENLKTYELYTK